MGQYSSYYLYQKYEKRGEQDWIPCYPNTFSMSGDSQNPMPFVVKTEDDPACGYTPKGSDDYNYEKWEVVDGYICDETTKYARERKYVSDDNVNWIATDIYRRSSTVLSYNSTDCGYDSQWDDYNCSKWEVVSNDYICNEGNKYQKLRKYVRQCENCDSCSSSWSATNIYKQGDIITYDSTDCGYVIGERMYRWIDLNPSTDYYCEGTTKYYKQQRQVSYDSGQTWANVVPPEYRMGASAETQSSDCTPSYIYRWVNLDPSVDYYCSGTTKYYKEQKQQSDNQGQTWENVVPAEYRMGTSAETQSSDCGYIGTKYRFVETDIEGCDGCELGEGVKSFIIGGKTVPDSPQTKTYFVSFDNNVTTSDLLIGHSSIYANVTGGTSLCLGEGVLRVNSSNKRAVTSLVLPNSVTSCTIDQMTSLTELILPPSITAIGYEMFYYCTSLTSVTISSSVTSIGDYAFNYCGSLKTVIIQATTPPTLGYSPFKRTSNDLKIYVPSGSEDAYKSASGWSIYANIIYTITI